VTSHSIVDVSNVILQGNGGTGGGLYADLSTVTLTNVSIVGNAGQNTVGGIWSIHSDLFLTNVVVAGNQATDEYGGIQLYGSDATLTNVVVAGNTAGGEGGGLSLDPDSSLNLDNSVVWGNSASSGGGIHCDACSATLQYTDVWANTPEDFLGMVDPTGMDGNIAVAPDFLDTSDPDPWNWDLHLALTSPLIDAGDPSTLDPDGSSSDIGAYGGPGAAAWDLDQDGYFEWWLPSPYDPATSPGMDCDDGDGTVYPGQGC